MADVSVATAPATPPATGGDKIERKKKSREGRSKTGDEKKKKKTTALGEEPKRKKRSKKTSASPNSEGHVSPHPAQDPEAALPEPAPEAAETGPVGDHDSSDGEAKFHDLEEGDDDSDSDAPPDHAGVSSPASRRQSLQSHKRTASSGSHHSYLNNTHFDPQLEETSVRQLSSGASLNVTTLRRSPSGRSASRHSVKTSLGNRHSLGHALEEDPAGQLASIPDAAAEPDTHQEPDVVASQSASPQAHPRVPSRSRIIDLDSSRPVSWRDTPAAQLTPESASPHEVGTPTAPAPDFVGHHDLDPNAVHAKKSLWSYGAGRLAGVSAAVGGGASSLTSGLGRSLTAGIAAVRRPTLDGEQGQERERVRLPRREVDEDQLAEEMMRFAEARHILRTENSTEILRGLGLSLEQAWREKVSCVVRLCVFFLELFLFLTLSFSFLFCFLYLVVVQLSEGQSLRSQLEETQDVLGDLEDENEHLRDQLGLLSEQIASREEGFEDYQRFTASQYKKERQLWENEVQEEKENALASVARLRRLLAQERAMSAQLRLVIHAVKSGRLDVLDKVDLDAEPPHEEADDAQSNVGEEVFDDLSLSPGKSKRKSHDDAKSPETEDGSEGLDGDVLYNLQSSSSKPKQNPGSAPMAANQPMHLGAMRGAGLVDTDPLMESGKPEDDTETVSGDSKHTVAIASRVLFDKAAADAALTVALQEENTALRSYQKSKERKYHDMELELAQYRARLAEAEAAIDDFSKA